MSASLFNRGLADLMRTAGPFGAYGTLRGNASAWAVTSEDDAYRYVLGREWAPERPLTWVFIMLNPSKARHDVDDPTIRKCRGFAERAGAGRFIVGNLFAYSATDPRDLVAAAKRGVNVVGEMNGKVLKRLLQLQGYQASDPRREHLSPRIVAAWGGIPTPLRAKANEVLSFIAYWEPICLGTTKDGQPRHPLMLAYDTPQGMWRMRGGR